MNRKLVAKCHKFSLSEFIKFLKEQNPRSMGRLRFVNEEKTISHKISFDLTRAQWENVLAVCAEYDVGYGSAVKLVLNQQFGLSPNLDDLKFKDPR